MSAACVAVVVAAAAVCVLVMWDGGDGYSGDVTPLFGPTMHGTFRHKGKSDAEIIER